MSRPADMSKPIGPRDHLRAIWQDFVTSRLPDDPSSATMRRVRFLNIFALVTIVALLVFGLFNVASRSPAARPAVGLVEMVFALVGALVLLDLRISQRAERAQNLTMIVTMMVMTFLLYTGGMERTGIYWWFCFPAGAFYLKGRRGGWLWVGASLVLFVAFMVLEANGFIAIPYSAVTLRQFTAAYLVVCLLMTSYEGIRDDYEVEAERKTQELAAANARLSEEVVERRRAEEATQAARLEAEHANRAKSEFLSRMSHELRTPMNSILGFSQLLESDPEESLTERQRASVREILASGRHLLGLISEVLDLSRIEAGRLALRIEPVLIGPVVREAISSVRPLADHRSVTFTVALEDEPALSARADTNRFRQVLLNLLSNAIKYNRVGGLVRVEAASKENLVNLQVTDTGLGIPIEKQDRVFTPFERLGVDATTEGSGIGLAITKQLVALMGGTISFTSTPGLGTCFTVTMPAADPRSPEASSRPSVTVPEPSGDAAGTVLYIEDDLANLALVRQILRRRPDLRVLHAARGLEGIELARSCTPDLVLLDIRLPDISGVEVLRLLQADPGTRGIPVVVVTASAMPHEIAELADSHVLRCLTKPLDVAEFLNAVDEALSTQSSGNKEVP